MPKDRQYRIMIYGTERLGLHIPAPIKTRNYELFFEPLHSEKRFHEFDGVILFQQTFENIQSTSGSYWNGATVYIEPEKYQLDKREKEANILIQNGGFICFILCKPFLDIVDGRDYRNTDLVKRSLNLAAFYRQDLRQSITSVRAVRSEFVRFMSLYGMAYTHFTNCNGDLPWSILAKSGDLIVGFILGTQQLFVSSLIPEQHHLSEYYEILCDAIVSIVNKLVYESPEWVRSFKFSEEDSSEERKEVLISEINQIDERMAILNNFKRILLCDGDLLVDSVTDIFKNGFAFKVDDFEEYREDLKLLYASDSLMAFCEVKGTNAGVKREHVNQADSHRERAGLANNFPALLIINTHIKYSRNLPDKDKAVSSEQIQHAARNNVLILRTIDLLMLLKLMLNSKITQDEVIALFVNQHGWLKVSGEKYEVLTC